MSTIYGAFCPTCLQFVAEQQSELIKASAQCVEIASGAWCKAFAEVYGLEVWEVRKAGLRPRMSVLAGQVMANQIRKERVNRKGKGRHKAQQ